MIGEVSLDNSSGRHERGGKSRQQQWEIMRGEVSLDNSSGRYDRGGKSRQQQWDIHILLKIDH